METAQIRILKVAKDALPTLIELLKKEQPERMDRITEQEAASKAIMEAIERRKGSDASVNL